MAYEVLKLVNNAEISRQALIKSNNAKGVDTPKTATLTEAIALAGMVESEATGHKVRFIDIDGNCETIYVEDGGTAVPPYVPNYDEEYIEFDSWVMTAESLDNVTERIDCGALYRSKALVAGDKLYDAIAIDNGSVEVRPTIIKCSFDETTGLNPTLSIGSLSPTTAIVYVDWGDGTAVETGTGSATINFTHTYSTKGRYVIRWWSNGTQAGQRPTNNYMLGSASLNNAIYAYYMGANVTYHYQSEFAYLNCVLNNTKGAVGSNGFTNSCIPLVLYNGSTLSNGACKYLVIPYGSNTNIYYVLGTGVTGEVVLPNTIHGSTNNPLQIDNVTEIKLPQNSNQFQIATTYSLKRIVLNETSSVTINNAYSLQEFITKNPTNNISITGTSKNLTTFIIPAEFSGDINIRNSPNISKESLLLMATNLKDKSADNASGILNLSYGVKPILDSVFINVFTGAEAQNELDGDTLAEYILSKNWTITYTRG